MSKIPINEKHNPKTAIFWASFETEPHQQTQHCPTVALYQNEEGFFAIEHSASSRMDPTGWEPIEDPQKWLDEQIQRLKNSLAIL